MVVRFVRRKKSYENFLIPTQKKKKKKLRLWLIHHIVLIKTCTRYHSSLELGTDTTYNNVGARTVWVKSLGSSLDKRQATVQLTVHADGMPYTSSMIVFHGKGLRITSEQQQWVNECL